MLCTATAAATGAHHISGSSSCTSHNRTCLCYSGRKEWQQRQHWEQKMQPPRSTTIPPLTAACAVPSTVNVLAMAGPCSRIAVSSCQACPCLAAMESRGGRYVNKGRSPRGSDCKLTEGWRQAGSVAARTGTRVGGSREHGRLQQ